MPRSWAPPPKGPLSDHIDLGQLWHILRERFRFIAGCAALVFAAVVAVTMTGQMTFKTHGSLYLGELQAKGGAQSASSEQFDFLEGRNGDVGTEIEILKSGDLIKRAILQTGMNVTVVPAGWTPPRYLRWRLARRDLDLLDLGARKLVALNTSLAAGAGQAKSFELRFSSDKTYELSSAGKVLGSGALQTPFVGAGVMMTLVSGSGESPQAGDTFALTITPLDQVAEGVSRALSITSPKALGSRDEVKVVTLDFVHSSPRTAAAFVSALMRTYLDRRQSWKSEEATAAEVFVTAQVKSMKDSLEVAERELADYKKGSNVLVLGEDARGMIEQLARYEEQRMTSRLQMASFSQIDRALKKGTTAPIEQYLVGESSDQVLGGLSHNLAEAQQELTRMEARFTGDAPALREQRTQVDTQLNMVRNYVLGRRSRAQEQLDSLNGMISQFEDKLKTVPHAEQQLAQLTRNSEVLSKMYSLLLERQQQIAVVKASTISKNRVLDVPEIPYREDAPLLTVRMIAAGFAGLLIGMILVLLRRLMASTFQTEAEVRKEMGELPLYGTIPRQRAAGRPFKKRDRLSPGPFDVFGGHLHSAFAEGFRHLRTNVYFSGPAKDDKVVLVTSPSQGDGKTLCTLSLAAALAMDGKRVLVMEGDMYRPSLHALLGELPQGGLSELLTRQAQWENILRSAALPGGGTFDVITAGTTPPSPAELLSSPQFGALIARAKRDYDFVLIDSPPFPAVSDALVMSMHADRVLTIVRPGNTLRRAAEEHWRRFSASTPRYGVVINDIEAPLLDGGYGYGNQHRPAGHPYQPPADFTLPRSAGRGGAVPDETSIAVTRPR